MCQSISVATFNPDRVLLPIQSPVLRVWFHFLDKKFGNKGAITPLKKLIVDQVSRLHFFFETISYHDNEYIYNV